MKVSTRQLRSAIRNFLREERAPAGYYDPPEGQEIPDELYDEMEDIFERAATDPDGKAEFKGADGYYTLEDDSLGGDGQYVLHDPSGKEDLFYANDKNAVANLEERIVSILMKAGDTR